eukprot:s920_g16.t2
MSWYFLDFHPSPILHGFKKERTPARIMSLLCDMPTGPHSAEKERLLCAPAASVDYHPDDARRRHYMKEAVVFMIKHSRPGDFGVGSGANQVRMRLCPACYHATPSRFSRCVQCWSKFISCGKFRRTEPADAETSVEVPNSNVPQTMEAAAAAVPATGAEEDEQLETMTVAMEVEEQPSEGEPEPDEELPDITEYPEDVSVETLEERQPVLPLGRNVITDPELLIAQTSMQPPYYPDKSTGYCVDALRPAFAYMAYCLLRTMYKVWPSTSSWLTMPYETMQERFRAGSRYDVLGNWPAHICATDPETNISKEVTDEDIRACANTRGEVDDPEGHWLAKRFRANQVLSALTRGSIQMGYTRSTFNPETYVNRGQSAKQMQYSCLGVLCEIIPKITGYTQFSLIRPAPTGPTEFLYIDPVGVILTQSLRDTSANTVALPIDHNVQVPAKFTDKVVKRKIDSETNPQVHAKRDDLHLLRQSDFMAAGQTSIMDTEVTQEQRERVARPSQPNPEREGQRRAVRNANSWVNKGEKGKGKSKTPAQREDERERYRRKGKGKKEGRGGDEAGFKRVEPQISEGLMEVTCTLVQQLAKPGCTIIVFLPGIADITQLFESLAPLDDVRSFGRPGVVRRPDCPRLRIFALHSMVPRQEQEEVFNEVPKDTGHVVLASNIAESSLTLPSVCAVVDLALRRTVQYDTRRLMCCLVTTWCSQSSCKQRRGRAGRTMPGRALCLVPRRYFESELPAFDPPEMLNAPLTKLYLQAKQLCSTLSRVSDRVQLPPDVNMDISSPKALLNEVVQPPSLSLLDAAIQELSAVGCLTMPTEEAEITPLGQIAVALPCDLRICRLLFLGCLFGCPTDALAMAAGLTGPDPFSTPSLLVLKDQKEYVQKLERSFASRRWCDHGTFSEPIMMHSLFKEWIRAGAPRGAKALGSFVRDWSIIPKKFESLTADATELTVRFLKLLKTGRPRSNLEELLSAMHHKVDKGDAWLSETRARERGAFCERPLIAAVALKENTPQVSLALPLTMSYSDAVSSSAKAAAPRKGFKLVLLGDASVGKSSILLRFLHNKFSEEIATTVGAAFNTKTIESKGRQVKFEIWDTAGQERFRSLAPMYYRGASAAIVVYDQTNAVTFDRAQEWVREVMSTSANPNIVIALAANKADMESKQQVSWEKAERFAQQQGLFLLDTSAMTGKNVLRLFEGIAELLPDEPFMPQQRGLQVLTTPTTTNATAATDQKASARSRCPCPSRLPSARFEKEFGICTELMDLLRTSGWGNPERIFSSDVDKLRCLLAMAFSDQMLLHLNPRWAPSSGGKKRLEEQVMLAWLPRRVKESIPRYR